MCTLAGIDNNQPVVPWNEKKNNNNNKLSCIVKEKVRQYHRIEVALDDIAAAVWFFSSDLPASMKRRKV